MKLHTLSDMQRLITEEVGIMEEMYALYLSLRPSPQIEIAVNIDDGNDNEEDSSS